MRAEGEETVATEGDDMNRPQSADNLERHLTQEPPVQEDAGTWCDELLHLIMQMPGEMHELALTAASRLDARAVQERDTAAAAMFVAYFAAERDRTVLLRTTDTLIRVGDPLTALFAFHKLRARTRTFGLVFHAEALAVGALAALDRIDGFCPPPLGLYLGTDEGNRTDGPGDAALSELWAALVSRDSDRVAELIATTAHRMPTIRCWLPCTRCVTICSAHHRHTHRSTCPK